MATTTKVATGSVTQVVGVVVDVEFAKGACQLSMMRCTFERGDNLLVLEVAQHLSETQFVLSLAEH